MKLAYLFAYGLLLLAITPEAKANKLFAINAISGSDNIIVDSASVRGLIENAVKRRNEFKGLIGNSFRADITYMGTRDAFYINFNNNSTTILIGSRLTPTEKVITGIDENDTHEQLEEFLKQGGLDFWTAIQREVAKQSAAAITDGNPSATTAVMSKTAYDYFGFPYIPTIREQANNTNSQDAAKDKGWWIHLGGDIKLEQYSIDTDVGKITGSGATVTIPFGFKFSERFSLIGVGEGNYTNLEGTEIFGANLTLGGRFVISSLKADSDWIWNVTPFVGVGGRGTTDGLSAAVLGQIGVNNVIAYRFNPHFIFSWTTQFDNFESIKFTIGDLTYDSGIQQQLVRTTLRASMPFCENWIGHLDIGGSEFIQSAAVDEWLTYGASLNYKPFNYLNIEAYSQIETGQDFTRANLGLRCYFYF